MRDLIVQRIYELIEKREAYKYVTCDAQIEEFEYYHKYDNNNVLLLTFFENLIKEMQKNS